MTSSNDAAATTHGPSPETLPPPATDPTAKSLSPNADHRDAASHTDTTANVANNNTTTTATTTTTTATTTAAAAADAVEPEMADGQTLQQDAPQPSLFPPAATAIATTSTEGQDLDPALAALALPDHYMPSPPTVSPLSTPAVTAIHSANGDHALDDDLPKLNDEQISLTQASALSQSLLAQSALQDLGHRFAAPHTQKQGYAAVATTDDDITYSPHPLTTNRMSRSNTMTNIDPAAFMIALASNTNEPVASDYPTAIAPSEISLAASQGQDDGTGTGTGTFESASASASQKLESFARIEFADSVFQMTTYAVIIGRDQRAMEQARKDERRAAKYREACEKAEEQGLPPPTPMGRDRGKFSKSYVSEEGGILGPESDCGDSNAPRRKAPSHHDEAEVNDEQDENAKSNLQYVSHSEGAAAVDLGMMQPSTSHVPFVGIHSPGPNIAARTKGISRQHLKIQFNERRGVFEGIALHKNGFFCDDVHYGSDDPVTIRSGSRLQIKDVEFFFVINGVEHGKTGAEDLHEVDEVSSKRCSVGGKEMSLEFEHSDQEQKKKFLRNTDSPSPARIKTPPPISEDGDDDLTALAEALEEEGDETMAIDDQSELGGEELALPYMDAATAAALLQSVERGEELPPDFVLPRRRGPGRPPKDGIMSKRERRLLKKQLEAQQMSRKTLPQEPPGEKIKRPVGRPRKNPLPEDGDRPEKRKYTKRKTDGEEGSDAERRAKEKKDKKVRPKSPPLDLKIEDYSAEQLKKPAKNYVHLIDEALQAGPPEGLSLKQIYKRITAKYPWYYFSAETKGWESSVRHNLIGNDGFKKNEETGLWQRVHGIDLDAGKKRKAPTPERQLGSMHHMGQQTYYQHQSYMQQGTLQFADSLHGNVMQNSHQHQSYAHPGSSQPTQNFAGHQGQMNSQLAHAAQAQEQNPQKIAAPGPVGMPRPGVQQNSYSSPYARPASTSNPQLVSAHATPNQQSQHSGITQPVSQNQQTQQATASAMSAGSRGPLGNPAENQKVVAFKEQMLKMLSSLNISQSKIQQLVETAINKAFDLPALPTLSGFEKVESRLTNEVLKILDKEPMPASELPTSMPASASPSIPVAAPTPAPTPTAPLAPAQTAPPPKPQTPAPRPSPAALGPAEAEIESSLAVFRDNFMKTFRSKCPQADFIMESAVNQAKGLPNAGKVRGWEQVNDLLVTEVTKIINNVKKRFHLQSESAAGSPAQPSQASPQPTLRQASSASPAPGQQHTPLSFASASTPAGSAPNGLAVPRPPAAAVRPSIARPGAASVARPSINRQNSLGTTQASSNPATTASSAIPQAPVASQPVAPSQSPSQQTITPVRPVIAAVPPPAPAPAPTSSAPSISQESHSLKPVGPLPPTATQPPLAKTASPAPPPTTKPSAGVMEQIMGQGQKRSLESMHGPGNDGTQQPEQKKLTTTPSTA